MTCAAILSLEDFRDTQRRAEMRQQLHDRFEQWLNQLEDRRQDPSPTVEELTQAIFVLRQEWTQAVTEGVVEYVHRAAVEQRTTPCPRCGQTWSARGPQERTVETLGGAIRLRRPYVDGEFCQRGSAPLDTALALTGRRQPSDVQKAAVKLTKELPDETACELCEELTGWPRSAHAAHEITQEVAAGLGVLEVAPTQAEITARLAAVAKGRGWRPIMVVAVDGAQVPTRPETAKGRRPGRRQARAQRAQWTGEWRAAKGVRCSRIDGERIVQVLSWHQVHTDEELATARRQVKTAGLIPEAQVRLCVIADGARWIWKQTHARLPSAVELVEYDHCREPLAKVAALQ
jgi:hypothetical protein